MSHAYVCGAYFANIDLPSTPCVSAVSASSMQPPTTWSDAVAALRSQYLDVADGNQLALAQRLGFDSRLYASLPCVVMAAVLFDNFSVELRRPPSRCTDSALQFLEEIWEQVFPGHELPNNLQSSSCVNAWIQYAYYTRRCRFLERHKPAPGDIAQRNLITFEVSSIGLDGRIYGKGGKGLGAWPDQINIVERLQDSSPGEPISDIRKRAQNTTSERSKPRQISLSRLQPIRGALLTEKADLSVALEDAYGRLASARNEHAMQEVFSRHPILLANYKLRGWQNYQWDRPRLGSEYIPDFVLADVDSEGIHYHLVELESPNQKMLNQDRTFSATVRTAIGQIQSWRAWIEDNIAYARKQFVDIESRPPGIIVVGRRPSGEGEPFGASVRRDLRRESGIEVRTYDGLLELISST